MVTQAAHPGWERIGFDPALEIWARRALEYSEVAVKDPALSHWWVCENTWFVGVDALGNDAEGTLPDGTRLPEALVRSLADRFGTFPFHKAQISVVRPGYPRPREGESEAAFRYREKRDAAHVDGLRPRGETRRRHIEEPHAYILGLPLNAASPDAAPLVVWEGSQEIMRAALKAAVGNTSDPADVDVTDIYQAARKEVFDTCKRVELHANPGEGYLLHRLSLHGVAPWRADSSGDRRIAYFRPEAASVRDWLDAP